MHRLPKIVIERLKSKAIDVQRNRQSTIESRQSPHLEANLLAAFVERTLSERERTEVLNHLAQCAECRELVALTLPAGREAAELKRSPGRRAWWAWPALRWGALAAALGAVAVLVVLRPHARRRHEPASNVMRPAMVASARKAAPPAAALPAPPRPRTTATKARAQSRESPRELAKLEKHTGAPVVQQIALPAPSAEAKEQMTLMRTATPPVTVEAAPTKAESAEVTVGPDTGLVGGAPAPSANLPASRLAKAMRAKSYPVGATGMAFRGAAASAVAQPAALWSISDNGKVQRSEDKGKTWAEMHVDETVTFRVIQVIGNEVWAGGTGGALYHSSDGGATWRRANLRSDGNSSTGTIVAIISLPRDLERITIVTASGELWTTEDGGQHWQKEP
jgi:hypothetical protein